MLRPLLILCLLPLLTACGAPARPPAAAVPPPGPTPGEPVFAVYVIPQGFHTGIAIRRADIPAALIPEAGDFPAAVYLEMGWGDWNFYQAVEPGLFTLLGAVFVPSASVLHVVGVEGALDERFPAMERRRLNLGARQFAALAAFLHESFLRNDEPRAAAIGPGLRRNSLFYPATGAFHAFNNCNTWVAQALEAAGLPIGRPLPFTADALMERVRRLAMATAGGASDNRADPERTPRAPATR